MELWPVIVSCWARSCANVVVAVDKLTSSPVTVPLTGPETSGRPATEMFPVRLVPVWASVIVTGRDEPACPAFPVHVPATLAVGAFMAAFCSSRAAAQPTMAMHNSVRRQVLVTVIMVSPLGLRAIERFYCLVRWRPAWGNGTFGLCRRGEYTLPRAILDAQRRLTAASRQRYERRPPLDDAPPVLPRRDGPARRGLLDRRVASLANL